MSQRGMDELIVEEMELSLLLLPMRRAEFGSHAHGSIEKIVKESK